MANNIPIQIRTIDPYSSYSSSVVNQLTRMITRGVDCISGTHSIDVSIDPVTPLTKLIVSPGICFKDDVIIEISSEFSIDMELPDFYLDALPLYDIGYYYVTLKYTYVKSKPAPVASIVILRNSQRTALTDSYLFLKCVRIIDNGLTHEIDSVYDFDPENTDIRRVYSQTYFGVEDNIPTYDNERDEGRVIYVRNSNKVYFGGSYDWISFDDSVKDSLDTDGCPAGSLIYLTSSTSAGLAIATSTSKYAVAIVAEEGLISEGTGKVILFGRCDGVPVESGQTPTTGQRLYLSNSEDGSATPLSPAPNTQFVGICLDFDAGSSTCSMWFMPGGNDSSGGGGDTSSNTFDNYTDLLAQTIFSKLTVDPINNVDYIDTVLTTATINSVDKIIEGENGQYFYSKNVVEPGYSQWIPSCQLSASTGSPENIVWYVSNYDNSPENYELLELDSLHYFGTLFVYINSSSVTDFEIGEMILAGTSLNTAIVCGYTHDNCILLRDIVGSGTFTVGETITGYNSGATSVVDAEGQIDRTTASNNNLYVRAYFSGDATISDYGIIYEEDPQVVGFTPNETGIGQFIDLDSTPSIVGSQVWVTISSGTPFNITNFDGGYDGKEITILFTSGDVTIKNNSNILLSEGSDLVGVYGTVISLIYSRYTNSWFEKSRNWVTTP